MNTSSSDNHVFNCANCGKGEGDSGDLKACTACKMVKYCGRDCQKAHRSQHKKECRLRAAELHDEALFKQPPPEEDCPICFLRLPTLGTGNRYNACCGKLICSGCIFAVKITTGKNMCPFCRALAPTSYEDALKLNKKRVEMGDPRAIYNLACNYADGDHGYPQHNIKALELWHRAAELGSTKSYCNIGVTYGNGRGVERDEKKAKYFYELAAIGGHVIARNNLGVDDEEKGNMERALKHYMIAVGNGYNGSLNTIRQMCMKGLATKDDYAKALKAYQAYLSEIKSDDRDKAAAYDELYKYYE